MIIIFSLLVLSLVVLYVVFQDAKCRRINPPLVFVNEDKRFHEITIKKTRSLIQF